mmetsp:Transcript_10502/g.33358  ORF Transcript_10502/g.33358 Transcript_10502/m.33358 type:complete len:251 (-) Transcript_10502:104-856(-)
MLDISWAPSRPWPPTATSSSSTRAQASLGEEGRDDDTSIRTASPRRTDKTVGCCVPRGGVATHPALTVSAARPSPTAAATESQCEDELQNEGPWIAAHRPACRLQGSNVAIRARFSAQSGSRGKKKRSAVSPRATAQPRPGGTCSTSNRAALGTKDSDNAPPTASRSASTAEAASAGAAPTSSTKAPAGCRSPPHAARSAPRAMRIPTHVALYCCIGKKRALGTTLYANAPPGDTTVSSTIVCTSANTDP